MRLAALVIAGAVLGAALGRTGVIGDVVARLSGSRVVRVRD